jgi:hypothetical protein
MQKKHFEHPYLPIAEQPFEPPHSHIHRHSDHILNLQRFVKFYSTCMSLDRDVPTWSKLARFSDPFPERLLRFNSDFCKSVSEVACKQHPPISGELYSTKSNSSSGICCWYRACTYNSTYFRMSFIRNNNKLHSLPHAIGGHRASFCRQCNIPLLKVRKNAINWTQNTIST